MARCQNTENRWEWHLKYVHEARSSHHKTCSIEHSLHFTGLDVLSIPNNSTYFQPNVSVKICEKAWEEVRWNCKNRKTFPSLCPWKVWDKSIFFSLQDFTIAWGGCWSILSFRGKNINSLLPFLFTLPEIYSWSLHLLSSKISIWRSNDPAVGRFIFG